MSFENPIWNADPVVQRRRPHSLEAISEHQVKFHVVVDPRHAEKQHAREPRDLVAARGSGSGPVREGKAVRRT